MNDGKLEPNFFPTIGIECHVQLSTKTKLFSAISNDARDAEPNTLISHICLGMPGALPVLNKKALEHAVRVAGALKVKPQALSYFERKHYFYPDLPKGYQITQLSHPIIKGGEVEIQIDQKAVTIRINRVQLEEDAGKSTHPEGKDYSLVDLNRAGTPLLEIVSEPDMHSSKEAKAYARELWLLMRYCRVSDADMYHGNMRFDVNVSVSRDPKTLGTRTETKNLNSFRSVERAVDYEIKRQIDSLKKGQEITQETRGWDEAKQKTFTQRVKEEAHDYRYFPDPDIPPIKLSSNEINSMLSELPVMPYEWRVKLQSYGLTPQQIEIILEAELDNDDISYLAIFEQISDDDAFRKKVADWFVNIEIPLRRGGVLSSVEYTNDERQNMYGGVYNLIQEGKLSSTNAKALIETLLKSGAKPKNLAAYADQQGLVQFSEHNEIEEVIKVVIEENPSAADDVRSGEIKAIGFLVGQVMSKTQGRANPSITQEIVKKLLSQ